jgi:hypothetical protein
MGEGNGRLANPNECAIQNPLGAFAAAKASILGSLPFAAVRRANQRGTPPTWHWASVLSHTKKYAGRHTEKKEQWSVR